MKIEVNLDNNRLPDKYTRHAAVEYMEHDFPVVSFPFSIKDVPAGTKEIAFALTDLDSIPVCGFEWIHWLVAGLDGHDVDVPEDSSRNNPLNWTQGYNSSAGHIYDMKDQPISQHYMGPKPPSGVHDYTLTVYALDTKLNFNDGFWYNELIHNMAGHIIEKVKIDLPVENN
ncbi:YbhB/YbcL family Raf kinase inhibitor-like protein [Apilactobacillus apinorum]|uniref:YbhB/YbcL family Raf kinase inhibitor-like protein n=1 Tax=Apilactobacillus apinorum TaxID=1218495 RepID=UPI0006B40FE0|nr:YbhB/YbcL family Raf kinase inhibitor-like protein [Apilactobacillus apinorum]KOY68476.1 Phospholipid-binding protein [Apilactobacillus apinorum]CAI2686713.1 B807_670 Phospholipid-binding protein [Apilactobacillus apinorum]